MKWSSNIIGSGLVALLGLAAPMGVSAATITGHIGFGGSVVYDTLAPTPSADATIDFYDEQTGLPDKTLGGGNGQVLRVGPTSGYFTGLSGYAEIKDITNAASDQPPSLLVIPGFNYGPAGLQFLSNFTGMAGLEFDLTRLDTQGGATCTGAEDRKSTRLNSSHIPLSRMPSSA